MTAFKRGDYCIFKSIHVHIFSEIFRTHWFDRGENAHIASEVDRLEDRLATSLEVQVDDEWSQSSSGLPAMSRHIPAVNGHFFWGGQHFSFNINPEIRYIHATFTLWRKVSSYFRTHRILVKIKMNLECY